MMATIRRIAGCVMIGAGLALFAYVLLALGAIGPKYLLVFHGTYWVFLAGIPLLLIGAGSAFIAPSGTTMQTSAVAASALAALYVVYMLVSLFGYMLGVSHGL